MDTGHLAAEGYRAGAIKYMLLDGFVPNPNPPVTVSGYVPLVFYSVFLMILLHV